MYGTINGADAYLGSRIGAATWLAQSEVVKSQLLTSAFDIIESLTYEGDKTDADQDNQFPRDGDTEVPESVINAEYQLANCLLNQGINPGEATNPNIKRAKTGPIETEFFEARVPFTLAGVVCPRAWSLLKPFFTDPDELTLIRNS